jgi:hypothetical protein
VGLANAEALAELTRQYWAAADREDWGDKLDTFLSNAVRADAGKAEP